MSRDSARVASSINRWLDAISVSGPTFCGSTAPPYLVLGVAGLAAGTFVLAGISIGDGIPIATVIVFIVASVCTFVAAGLIRQRLRRGPHILIEDIAFSLAATAAVAYAIGLPVLASMDRVAIALGVFLVFGRIGCLASGCCHGRPARIGVQYPEGKIHHALVGIRLYPVQLIEAAWIALITGVAHAFDGSAGGALKLWLLGYATVRFVLEWLRGDLARWRLGPLSEAQWLAIATWGAVIGLEYSRSPFAPELAVALAGAIALVVVMYLTRRRWFTPPRVALDGHETAGFLAALGELDRGVGVGRRSVVAATLGSGSVEIAVEIDAGDGGSAIAAHTITARDVTAERLWVLVGLVVQRRPWAAVLRAAVDAPVAIVWLHDPTPGRASSAVAAIHATYRAQAVITALGDAVREPTPAMHRAAAAALVAPPRAEDYLRPSGPS